MCAYCILLSNNLINFMANYEFDRLKDLAGKYVDSIDSWKSEEDPEKYSKAFEMAEGYKQQFNAVLAGTPDQTSVLENLARIYGDHEVYFLTREY